MRLITIGLIFSIVINTSLFSQHKVTSEKSTKVVDGNVDDWTLPLKNFSSSDHFQYGIANDDSSLYLCFIVSEPLYQMKILRGGMSIHIDTASGNKKDKVNMSCPIQSVAADMYADESGIEDNPLTDVKSEKNKKQMRDDLPKLFNKFSLTGFKKSGKFTNENSNDVKIQANFDTVNLYIEYGIKFSSFYNPSHISDSTKKFVLAFIVYGLPQPELYGASQGATPTVNMSNPGNNVAGANNNTTNANGVTSNQISTNSTQNVNGTTNASGNQPSGSASMPVNNDDLFESTDTKVEVHFSKK